MRLATQFLKQRLILLYADIFRALRVMAVGALIAESAGSGRSVAQGLETETIKGTVVNSITHEPIGRALVFSLDNRFAMLCDAGGHFEFRIPRQTNGAENGNGSSLVFYNGAGGDYGRMGGPAALLARKPGFLSDEKAQRVTLANDAEQGLTIQLVPEALIIGRVNLPTTDGTDRLTVELYKRTVQDGRARWEQAGSTRTRANGTFRFADLGGGSYKIFTQEEIDRDPLTFDPRGQLYGYPPVYYPSFNDFESSSTIRLTAGATVSVNLTPMRREYYPIKIGISNAPQGAGFQIEAWPQGHPGPGYSLGYEQDEQSIVGMLPDGNYTVEANAYGPTISTGQMNIGVKGGGVEGATLSLVPNGSIQVNVKQEMTASEMASQGSTYEVNGKPASKSHLKIDPTLVFDSGGGQAEAAGAGVVWVVGALHELARLEPRHQPRHAGLADQNILAQFAQPQPVGCCGQRVQDAVRTRAEVGPRVAGSQLPCDRGLRPEQRLPGLVCDPRRTAQGDHAACGYSVRRSKSLS